jgi:hypothetical protein
VTSKRALLGANGCISTAQVEPVVVNIEMCQRVAALLKSRRIPEDRENTSLTWMSPEEVGNFYLMLVAICHQTSPRDKPPLEGTVAGRHLRGWEYLSAKLEATVRLNLGMLSPRSWAGITTEEIRQLFYDETFGDRLSDPEGRASLVADLGQKMLQRSWDKADRLYDACEGRIATGRPDLLSLLAQFRAYADPVYKKSFFFLALMHNSGLWTYADPDQLGAPIDYHEVRGHLRIGTVEICDADLRAALMAGREVTAEQDIRIRQAVLKAVMLISELSGMRNASQLHYVFWNVFRSCCGRQSTHCISCPPTCSLPTRYIPLALFPDGIRRCPFSSDCKSAGQESKLLEQNIETDYY